MILASLVLRLPNTQDPSARPTPTRPTVGGSRRARACRYSISSPQSWAHVADRPTVQGRTYPSPLTGSRESHRVHSPPRPHLFPPPLCLLLPAFCAAPASTVPPPLVCLVGEGNQVVVAVDGLVNVSQPSVPASPKRATPSPAPARTPGAPFRALRATAAATPGSGSSVQSTRIIQSTEESTLRAFSGTQAVSPTTRRCASVGLLPLHEHKGRVGPSPPSWSG